MALNRGERPRRDLPEFALACPVPRAPGTSPEKKLCRIFTKFLSDAMGFGYSSRLMAFGDLQIFTQRVF